MNAKKKIAAIAVAAALAATTAISATLAYFTDAEQKDNVFTVGNVDITLTEPNWDSDGSSDAPEAYPGEALAKDPTVKNDGANPCFVRIKVEGWDVLGENNKITYRTDYVDNKLGDNWKLHDDGYFYYNQVLAVGATTDALFDQIVIPTTVTNGFDGSYDLVVKAEAVQAQGARARFGTGAEGETGTVMTMTVAEIADWFGTCMPTD